MDACPREEIAVRPVVGEVETRRGKAASSIELPIAGEDLLASRAQNVVTKINP